MPPKLGPGDRVVQRVLLEVRGQRLEGTVASPPLQLLKHSKPGWWYRVHWDGFRLVDRPYHEEVLILFCEARTES